MTVSEADADAPCLAVKRAQLYPTWTRGRVEVRPDGILSARDIGVVRPLVVLPLEFNEVALRTREALDRSGIPARVAGVRERV